MSEMSGQTGYTSNLVQKRLLLATLLFFRGNVERGDGWIYSNKSEIQNHTLVALNLSPFRTKTDNFHTIKSIQDGWRCSSPYTRDRRSQQGEWLVNIGQQKGTQNVAYRSFSVSCADRGASHIQGLS